MGANSLSLKETNGIPEIEFKIPGLILLEEIGRGASSTVYLAEKSSPSGAKELYAVKLLNDPAEGQNGNKAIHFGKEAGALARIRHKALIRIMEVGETSGRVYFVMDYVNGQNLSATLKSTPLSEDQIVKLAIDLAGALQEVHRHNLIHCDIKPQNILIDQAGNPKLIDFGLSAQLDRQKNHNEMVGTLAYCSPEQIGLLDRPIDGRSDLYSLGIVLFEMCTGVLPFYSRDAGRLMKQHAQLVAPDSRKLNPSLSPALAQIIAKLLSKNPDDRYQSSSSLLSDLERIKPFNALYEKGETPVFGSHDFTQNHVFATRLIGRKLELQSLRDDRLKIQKKGGGISLVTGSPGSGKKRLIEAFCEELYERASHDQFDDSTPPPCLTVMKGSATSANMPPLTPLRNALESYISKELKSSKQNQGILEKRFKNAAGDLAPVLQRFSPILAELLNLPPNSSEADQTREQYFESIATLFANLATAETPLVLVINDVQWLDDSTYQVLQQIAQKSLKLPLHFICSGKNDSSNENNIKRFCSFFKTSLLSKISLAHFDMATTQELISAHLGNAAIDENVSKPIFDRTDGNPFAIEQFLFAMLAEGVLRPSWDTWCIDHQKLSKLELPTNVEEMIALRIKSLSESSIRILGIAALLGGEFAATLLSRICNLDPMEINSAIMEAVHSNLIELKSNNNYAFLHNRAQETLISQFDKDTFKRLHQNIALALDNTSSDLDCQMDTALQIANHYNLGIVQEKPYRVFEVNFSAARHLIRDYADEEAYRFLQISIEALKISGHTYPLHFQEIHGDLCIRTGRLDEGISFLEALLKITLDPIKKAHLCGRLCSAWLYNGNSDKFWFYTKRAFHEIGLPAPKESTLNIFQAFIQCFIRFVLEKFIIFLERIKLRAVSENEREKSKILTSIANTAKLIGFFQGKIKLATNLALRTLHCSRYLGQTRELVYFHMYHALYLAVLNYEKQSNESIEKAISVAETIGDRIAKTRSIYYRAFCSFIMGKELEAVRQCKTSIKEHSALSIGDDNVMLTVFHHMSLLLRGKSKDFERLNKQTIEYFEQKSHQNYKENHGFLLSFSMAAMAISGRKKESLDLLKQTEIYFSERQDYLSQVWVNLCCQAFLYLEQGETGDNVDRLIQKHESYGEHCKTDMIDVCSFYVPKVYLRIAQWRNASLETKTVRLKQVNQALSELKRVAHTSIMNGHLLMTSAIIDFGLGHDKRTERQLEKVEKIGFEIDSPWLLYEVSKLRAELFKKLGNTSAADTSARIAINFAVEQKWDDRITWLNTNFNCSFSEDNRISLHSEVEPDSEVIDVKLEQGTSKQTALLKRNMDALLELATASANILDPDEQALVALRETVRLLSAERGFLFLAKEQGDELYFKIGVDSLGEIIPKPDNYSKSVTQTVQDRKEPVVFTGSGENSTFTESIIANNLRSIIATPLIMKDRFIGALYLDSRVAKGIFSDEDLGILKVLGNHFAIAIETAKTARLEIEKNALQKDFELTRAIQALILPKSQDYKSDSIEVSAFLQSAAQVGGDWWWLDTRESGKIRVLLGDVTGHGAGPAMVTAIIASSYKTMQEKQKNTEIPEILETLDHILQELCGGNYWMTLSAVEIDPNSGVVEWWNACAPAILLMKPDGKIEIMETESDGPLMPIGSKELKAAYRKFEIKQGEKILLFTDGLFEFKHHNGEEFGLRRLKALLSEAGQCPSTQQLREKVRKKSEELFQNQNLEDDITFVAIERSKFLMKEGGNL